MRNGTLFTRTMTMTTSFNKDEIPSVLQLEFSDEELRCPHMVKITRGDRIIEKKCNRLFCKGGASTSPQQFKCPNCGNLTIFKKA